MESKLEQIREQQKTTWNKFSSGWSKYNAFNMKFLQPMGDLIISHLALKPSEVVLDVATGTGEPGLTIAGIVKHGKVIATDLSEEMLRLADAESRNRHLDNFETRLADCCELPFPDAHFDAISCRMGFMFFPDMQMATNEMYRVLKPGGKMATSVWGAAGKNAWTAGIMGVLAKNIELPPPQPGAPGMFRCADTAMMTKMFEQAGFTDIQHQEIEGFCKYESPEEFWKMMCEVAAPVVHSMAGADEATKERIHQGAVNLFSDQKEEYKLPYAAVVYSVTKQK